jgi:hypothetical protein
VLPWCLRTVADGEFLQDMDLYDEKRTLVHAGVLARRDRDWCGWTEHFVALLDNYRGSASRGSDFA